jgi:LysR family glycine cleavage system transcriptional activator
MNLPPLNALRAFEAAGRHNSFAKASEEMHLSPGAISRQVRLLEEYLSLRLFDRKAQGLALTEVGKQFLPEISDAFQRIASAAGRTSVRSSQIRVLVAPTFAVRWLIPRLSQFRKLYPSIRVSIGLHIASEQFVDGVYDVGISQEWWLENEKIAANIDTRLLRYEQLTPVCAPALAKRSPRLRKPSDLRGKPLLHAIDTKDWKAWLGAVGETGIRIRPGSVYPTGDAAARAAMSGKGVAMVDRDLYKYELDSGELVAPFDFVLRNASAIVLLCSRGRANETPIRVFFDWLVASLQDEA